jgi:hypothetical protein
MGNRKINLQNDNEAALKFTPKQAVEVLTRHGTIVTEEEAEKILVFMQQLGNIALDQYLEGEKDTIKK